MIAERIATLKMVAEMVERDGQLSFALRDFLDGFYEAPSCDKLTDEPPFLTNSLHDDGFADAYLAAVCDHLCRKFQLPPPPWIHHPLRILKKPYFAAKTVPLRMLYLQESPTAFRKRNIFVSENALSRA
jgi:hypothetical protein